MARVVRYSAGTALVRTGYSVRSGYGANTVYRVGTEQIQCTEWV